MATVGFFDYGGSGQQKPFVASKDDAITAPVGATENVSWGNRLNCAYCLRDALGCSAVPQGADRAHCERVRSRVVAGLDDKCLVRGVVATPVDPRHFPQCAHACRDHFAASEYGLGYTRPYEDAKQ
jgi:hypothetical protein